MRNIFFERFQRMVGNATREMKHPVDSAVQIGSCREDIGSGKAAGWWLCPVRFQLSNDPRVVERKKPWRPVLPRTDCQRYLAWHAFLIAKEKPSVSLAVLAAIAVVIGCLFQFGVPNQPGMAQAAVRILHQRCPYDKSAPTSSSGILGVLQVRPRNVAARVAPT